ncbi:VRR-NUC domain-containing protein [Rothia koreensis]|uniref:VRR-NUC domain-containing protein n=1 Tax=Rothia koreensis TaxID=592378 RepID=UPI0037C8628F
MHTETTTTGRRTFATATQAREHQINQWTEKQLQTHIMLLARRLKWRSYHTHDSRRSQPGFPDLVLVRPDRGVLWRELKTTRGRLTRDQQAWLNDLTQAGQNAAVWRPANLLDGTIQKELT